MKAYGAIRRSLLVGAFTLGALLLFSVARGTALAQTNSPFQPPIQLHPGTNILSADFLSSQATNSVAFWNMNFPPLATAIHFVFNNLSSSTITFPGGGFTWSQAVNHTCPPGLVGCATIINTDILTCVVNAYSGNEQIYNANIFAPLVITPNFTAFLTCVVPPTGLGQLAVQIPGGVTTNFTLTAWVEDGRQFPDVLIGRAPCNARVPPLSPQSAVNSLPVGGGVICVSPGTYAGPTSVPNGTNFWCFGGSLPVANIVSIGGLINYGPSKVCTFQYTAGLTLSNVADIGFHWITLDFQNTASITNLTLSAVSYSNFEMAVVNCNSTSPCLSITAPNAANSNSAENYFPRLILAGGEGLFVGAGNVGTSGVTDNYFGDVQLIYPLGTGVTFSRNCDSNHFERIGIWTNQATINGVVFNSASNVMDEDADDIDIGWIDFTTGTLITSGVAFTFRASHGNRIGAIGFGANAFPMEFTFAGNAQSQNYILDLNQNSNVPTIVSTFTVPFANLPAAANGTVIGCADCTSPSNPCVGAGAGALAIRQGGAWVCK